MSAHANSSDSNKKTSYNSLVNRICRYTRATAWVFASYCTVAGFMQGATNLNNIKLTPIQAKNYVLLEQKTSLLKNKNIELIILDNNTLSNYHLSAHNLGSCHYTANGKHYILFDKDNISRGILFHELGHTALSKTLNNKVSLSDVLKDLDADYNLVNGQKNTTAYLLKYTFSPTELFCNIYSLKSAFLK